MSRPLSKYGKQKLEAEAAAQKEYFKKLMW
jgi:dTDP-4-dehydrorhamnose reductase